MEQIAEYAVQLIRPGSVVGLGTGRAAWAFLERLGQACSQGLEVRGVATSLATARLARQLGVPLTTLDEVEQIDIDFDGADAVDPNLNLIKGLGGALLREKIVAAASKTLVVLVGSEKLVPAIGQGRGSRLPVEIIPFGWPLIRRRFQSLGLTSEVRTVANAPFVSDNGNWIIDCDLPGPIANLRQFEIDLRSIPGVVDTGLFLGMAQTVLVQHGEGRFEILESNLAHG